MVQRVMIAGGIAGVLTAAAAMLAPEAAAQELAPGLSCGESSCRNDTGDTYRVEATAVCSGGAYVDATTYAGPHRRTDVVASCPSTLGAGTWDSPPPTMNPDGTFTTQPPVYVPGSWEYGYVIRIDYTRAVVDNDPHR
ncbi:hypothetical protein LTV02_05865 [Nocardia yamanashiensis]|uniref:hypothetical protein n=1 Tax=Nocardia yamanashiensis TaxID=209247 RepID=UPI001E626B3F|nr:hypothetical protein [Nocardia yamanashiensis]UGT42924.1 hypothetical protein LTV02_05865 [Nocardia yamanashiensis]